MRILVLHGPNLNLLGFREPEVYGATSLAGIMEALAAAASPLGVGIEWEQHDGEGALVDALHRARGRFDGVLLNPGAYTHTSVALRDALQALDLPCVEVHLSNTAAREGFRHRSLTAAACVGQVMGFGADSYRVALEGLVARLRRGRAERATDPGATRPARGRRR